jgi:hypothetical protein
MTNQPEGKAKEIVLKRCNDLIDWYESQKRPSESLTMSYRRL